MIKTWRWAAVCAVAAVATACGGGGSTSAQYGSTTAGATATAGTEATKATTATATANSPTITIADMNFGEPVTVVAGAQVKVVNNDSVEHSVTSQTANQFSVDVEGNEAATFTAPNQAGEYPLHCTYHPSMKGTLIVQ